MDDIQLKIINETLQFLVERIATLEKRATAHQTLLNLLLARSDLAELSLHDLYESHWTREKLAEKARQNAAELLDARAEHPNSEYEEYLTLTLAALLEAVGEPPPR